MQFMVRFVEACIEHTAVGEPIGTALVTEGKSIDGINDVVADWEAQLGFIRQQSLDALKSAKEGTWRRRSARS